MTTSLLPPNATALERGLADSIARISDVPIDLAAEWNPWTCPIRDLPWLAWGLSVDRWDPVWSDDRKREAVASAIPDQRIKGTRLSAERVLASFDDLLDLVEPFEATPQLDPYTFEVRLPLQGLDGSIDQTRVSAAFARAIVTEVARVKPARAHFELVQQIAIAALPAPICAAQATGYRRIDSVAGDGDAGIPWSELLQDQNGEPLSDDAGTFIDGSAS